MTMRLKTAKRLFSFVLGIGMSIFIALPAPAQDTGLGYSEAPFALVDNAAEAIGDTPLEAIQSASADEETITEETLVEQDDYALSTLTFNYIGVTAITKKSGSNWQFVCRAGGVMRPEELNQRCGVPSLTAESLYANLLEALSNNE